MNEGETKGRDRELEVTPRARPWLGYGVAVVGTVVAALVRWGLGQAVGNGELPPYISFYPAVLAAAAAGGTGPGVAATLLSALAADLLFLKPAWSLGPATMADAVGMGLFTSINIGISVLGGRLRAKSEAFRESEARLRMAHQAAHIGAFEWNVQTGVNIWTPEQEAMYGLKPGEFGGTEPAWEQLVHPEDRAKAMGLVDEAFKTFQPVEGEWRVVWPDGSVHWLVGRVQAFKDHAGKPLRLTGVNIDITYRKQAEEALRRSEERFRAFVTASSDVVYRMSPDWSEMRELRGRDFIADTEAPNRTWLRMYIDPEDQPHVLAVIEDAIRAKSTFELEHRVRRVDGSLGWTFSRAIPLRDAKGEIVEWFGAASDVTKRKEAEQALRDSEERFRTMADAIPQLAWVARADGYVFWYNRRWYEYTGSTPGEMEGWGWQSVHDPQVLPEVLQHWRRSIATGQPVDIEFPLRGADGQFRPFLTRVMPLKDRDGRVVLWFGTSTDIAELKEAQAALRRLKDELEARVERRTAELAAANRELKDFATIVSHDLKTPLRGVATLATWLQTDYADRLDEGGREHLTEMVKRVTRMDRMIDDILQYSRAGRAGEEPEPVALADLVPAVVQDLAPPGHVRVDVAPGLPVVPGEPVRLRQVFQNLIGNAIKYANKPEVEIKAFWADSGPLWQFSVADNGPGIEERHFERIFKIFQTLAPKDKTDSTGVGLALVKRIVEGAGGRVWVESRLGEGSTFHFTWPKEMRRARLVAS